MNPHETRHVATTGPSASISVSGEVYHWDEELNALLVSGAPAVLEVCRHGRQVIKQDHAFLIADHDGSVYNWCNCGTGLYVQDTRFLNGWQFKLENQVPTLLSSSSEKNYLARIEFMNSAISLPGGIELPQETLYVASHRLITTYLHERLEIVNYNPFPVTLRLVAQFSADFVDMFEVRGAFRGDRGRFLRPKIAADSVAFTYVGADGHVRQTRLRFAVPPARIQPLALSHATGAEVCFEVSIGGGGQKSLLEFWIEPLEATSEGKLAVPEPLPPFEELMATLEAEQTRRAEHFTRITSSNEVYNLVIQRNVLDLEALTTQMAETGPYIVAGIPWFASPFGRDGLIAAYQSLLLGPELARGTMRYLARFQGTDTDDYRDEEPGKILHEVRFGELARLKQVPHTPYFGSIDSTPLYLILLSETFRWTGDLDFVRELWESAEQALMWIDAYGDVDGDGFLEYKTRSKLGLYNQCWKDSPTSNIRPDFSVAELPVAVAEVQGYVYDAKMRMAELCDLLDLRVMGDRLKSEAKELKIAFNQAFWNEEDGFYCIALDAQKRQIRTMSSNPGHGLWSGIIDEGRIPRLAEQLLSPDMFSGWGIRTLSAGMAPYNPLSYHNGSIWPHDNSLIAKGLADNGHVDKALTVMNALYQASLQFPYYRLPELFCGFAKAGELDKPIPYPVACSPQAWAAGAPFLLLRSVLGLNPDAHNRRLIIKQPTLPLWLDELTLRGLRIGETSVDLQFLQVNGVTTVRVLDKRGPALRILVEA